MHSSYTTPNKNMNGAVRALYNRTHKRTMPNIYTHLHTLNERALCKISLAQQRRRRREFEWLSACGCCSLRCCVLWLWVVVLRVVYGTKRPPYIHTHYTHARMLLTTAVTQTADAHLAAVLLFGYSVRTQRTRRRRRQTSAL